MKLERLPEYLLSVVVTILGLAFALYAGNLIGSGNTRNLMLIAGGLGFVAIGLLFKERIWVLIFLFWACNGRLLSTPFSLHDAGVLLAFSWFLIFKAFKRIRNKPNYGFADVLVFINLLYVVTMFIRNPVGGLALDSDTVGGRPYVNVAIAALAYWVLVRADVSLTMARRLPYLAIIGHLPGFIFSLGGLLAPSAVMPLARIYAGIEAVGGDLDLSSTGGSRLGFLRWISGGLLSLLVCIYRPFTLINPLYLGRFLAMVCVMICVLFSGFRSFIIYAGLIFSVTCLYRGKIGDMIKISVIAVPALVLFIAGQGVLYQLPFPIQRALSFLPGQWEESAQKSADGSSEWRFEMWQWMWEEEKYLKNWWLGDGFGYSRKTLEQNVAAANGGDYRAIQETFLITGEVHSGPLSTIRYAGGVGLVLYLLLAFIVVKTAHDLIIRCRGTPYFFPVLFIGVPMVFAPFFFIFIFGGYSLDLPNAIFHVGLLRLLERGFNRYLEEKKAEMAQRPSVMPALLDQRPTMLTR